MNEPMLWWGLALLAAALLLIFVEVFVPSGGIISMVSAVVAIAGVVCLFRVSVGWGLTGVLMVLILGPMAAFFALQMLPSTPMGKKLLHGAEGMETTSPAPPDAGIYDALAGQEGEAVTDLRPVGVVRIDGKRVDALSEVSVIRAGTRVRVTSVQGRQVKVRPVA